MALTLNVITICGSLRKGSFNAVVARALPALAPEGLVITPAPSFAGLPVYNFDDQLRGFPDGLTALANAIRAADGLIFVSPEYNFSIPGGLKNAIDWLSRLENQPFADKPVAIQSAAGGPVGGARMQYHLRQSLAGVGAYVMNKPEIFVGNAASRISVEKDEITDETTRGFITQQLAAFAKFVERLRPR